MSSAPHRRRDLARGGLALLAPIAAAAGGFGAVGAAMWTNIHVDGHPDATVASTIWAVADLVLLFWAPALVIVVGSRFHKAMSEQRTFGVLGAITLGFFTFGWGLLAFVGVLTLWAVVAGGRHRPLRNPPLDIAVVSSYLVLLSYFAYAETHR